MCTRRGSIIGHVSNDTLFPPLSPVPFPPISSLFLSLSLNRQTHTHTPQLRSPLFLEISIVLPAQWCGLSNCGRYIFVRFDYFRGKEDDDKDIEDLVVSFSGLEEKVLAQYTFAKANYVRTAATNYLLDAGVQWGGAPAVKGVRDPAVELLHTLVAVHADVFAGCEPLLDKTLGILVEGLIDTLLSLFHEHKDTDLRLLDANGYCQLMLELEYFETILNQYFTADARESLKSLQGILLEKATESSSEASDTPSHRNRPTRGSDDAPADDKQQGTVSPDDLIALAQQCSTELLQSELERTRINTACFMESFPLESAPESAKVAYASFRGSMDASGGSFMGTQSAGASQRWR